MPSEVIREFLVSLSYKIDPSRTLDPSAKRIVEHISGAGPPSADWSLLGSSK